MPNPETPRGAEAKPATPHHVEVSPENPRHVTIKDESDRTLAAARVTTDDGPAGTVRTSLHADPYTQPGYRASLVDVVMDLPEVQASERVEATVPYGDSESIERLRERTEDPLTRAAGATTLLDANIPDGARPEEEASAGPLAEPPSEPPSEPPAGGQLGS